MSTFPSPTIRRDRPAALDRVGTLNSASGISLQEFGFGPLRCTEFTFSSYALTMTDEAGTVLYGGIKMYDFPEGIVGIVHACADLDLTYSGGINADADGDFALGTATATNTAIGSKTAGAAEQEILAYGAITQAASSATSIGTSTLTSITALTNSTGRTPDDTIANHADLSTYATDAAVIEQNVADLAGKINEIIHATNNWGFSLLDGTSTAKDLYANFLIDDADHDGGIITITGTIWVWWMLLGDY